MPSPVGIYDIQACVHVQPAGAKLGKQIRLADLELVTLDMPRPFMGEPFELDFEEVVEAASRLERFFIGPDGSFVWVSSHDMTPWQLDGNLCNQEQSLLFMDIKGNCPPAEFDRLLNLLGWPATVLMFEFDARDDIFARGRISPLGAGRKGVVGKRVAHGIVIEYPTGIAILARAAYVDSAACGSSALSPHPDRRSRS